jgi:hypothetical protein
MYFRKYELIQMTTYTALLFSALATSLPLPAHAETSNSSSSAIPVVNPSLSQETPLLPGGSALPNSTASIQTSWYKDVLSQSAVTFFSEYYGPSVGSPSANLVDDTGTSNGYHQYFDSSMIVAYKINGSTWTVGGAYNFAYIPVTGQDLTTEDPYLKVGNRELIKNGHFTMGADLRFYPGLSHYSQAADQTGYFRSVQVMNYDIPNTKFSISNLSWVRYYFFNNRAQAMAFGLAGASAAAPYETANFQVSTIPGINYQATPKLGFTLQYEMDTYQLLGNPVSNWTSPNQSTGLYAMVSWDMNRHINLNPFVEMQTGGRITIDSTVLGAYITAKLL